MVVVHNSSVMSACCIILGLIRITHSVNFDTIKNLRVCTYDLRGRGGCEGEEGLSLLWNY